MSAAARWERICSEYRRKERNEGRALVYNDGSNEQTAPPHRPHRRPRAVAGAPARHCLDDRGGIRLFHHGLAHEAPVRALRAYANVLSALPFLLAVPIAADWLA